MVFVSIESINVCRVSCILKEILGGKGARLTFPTILMFMHVSFTIAKGQKEGRRKEWEEERGGGQNAEDNVRLRKK